MASDMYIVLGLEDSNIIDGNKVNFLQKAGVSSVLMFVRGYLID